MKNEFLLDLHGNYFLNFTMDIFKCQKSVSGNIERIKIGEWVSSETENISFVEGRDQSLHKFGKSKILQVAVVQQKPFVFWNNQTGFFLLNYFT